MAPAVVHEESEKDAATVAAAAAAAVATTSAAAAAAAPKENTRETEQGNPQGPAAAAATPAAPKERSKQAPPKEDANEHEHAPDKRIRLNTEGEGVPGPVGGTLSLDALRAALQETEQHPPPYPETGSSPSGPYPSSGFRNKAQRLRGVNQRPTNIAPVAGQRAGRTAIDSDRPPHLDPPQLPCGIK